jgi:hypothetical protein
MASDSLEHNDVETSLYTRMGQKPKATPNIIDILADHLTLVVNYIDDRLWPEAARKNVINDINESSKQISEDVLEAWLNRLWNCFVLLIKTCIVEEDQEVLITPLLSYPTFKTHVKNGDSYQVMT